MKKQNIHTKTYDVIIVGGGIVGLTVACGLQNSGINVAVLEKKTPTKNSSIRVLTINNSSKYLLEKLGVWDFILESCASAYNSIEVWNRDSFAHIIFHNDQNQRISHMGYVVEDWVVHNALWQIAQKINNITLISPVILDHVLFNDKEASIKLKDGRLMSARLLIAADGANSWLRNKANIPIMLWDYQHNALVANIRSEKPHNAVARQVFHNNGILAFLPLRNPYLCSIVWSLPPDEVERLVAMPKRIFNQYLSLICDLKLGLCNLESQLNTFPIMGRYARDFATHRLALVGDAAHTIHPLAGQGLNLGFMDAAELIKEIKQLHKLGKDIGNYMYLRRYERRRKYSTALMLTSIQGLQEIFNGDAPIKKLLRGIGLMLVNSLPVVKNYFIKHATGSYTLSERLNTYMD